ncbi:hypothetical protein H9L19_03270 [Weissella diestrammenae]|uniref:WxL domain-containing protein n=1 Tax=Weissella diestrammenae TaxID=1162633 RepID=A0A7G9T718_9LACO|nr:hypothetical protein [Weissella diestrammenae]MCM0582510.1 hypothetical protein [Weissella diestrammenae]QNN75893.1 hypothetical protein H9L19_03270 [Weissella diestrammenae]
MKKLKVVTLSLTTLLTVSALTPLTIYGEAITSIKSNGKVTFTNNNTELTFQGEAGNVDFGSINLSSWGEPKGNLASGLIRVNDGRESHAGHFGITVEQSGNWNTNEIAKETMPIYFGDSSIASDQITFRSNSEDKKGLTTYSYTADEFKLHLPTTGTLTIGSKESELTWRLNNTYSE